VTEADDTLTPPTWRGLLLGPVLRGALLVLAVLVVPVFSTGWLYLLRGHVLSWPGPRLNEVLTLDVLPGHDGVPLIAYLLVTVASALLLGLAARLTRVEPVAAALTIATGVGLVTYLTSAVAWYVTKQVTFRQSLITAAGFKPVYVGAAIFGVGGALLARRAPRARWATTVIVYAVSVGGVLDVLSALIPAATARTGLAAVVPSILPPIAEALVVPAGLVLLMSARGLGRGNHVAWRVALLVSSASAILNLERGTGSANAAAGVAIAVLLVARRHDFERESDPMVRVPAIGRLVAVVGFAYAYALVALVVNRVAAGLPVHLARAADQALKALVGIAPSGRAAHIGGQFTDWYPWSVVSIVAVGVAWATATWIGPWRERTAQSPLARREAAQVIRRWGADTLAPFALREDKELYFHRGGDDRAHHRDDPVVLAYRVVRGVAIVTGDPIGPSEEIGPAVAAFRGHARERGWRVAILGASAASLGIYGVLKMRPIYHGDEALIATESFTLAGPPMRTVRQAVHRVERKGYRCQIVRGDELDALCQSELAEVDQLWLQGKPRTGFVMQLDDLFRQKDDALFVIGRRADGAIDGFLHVAVCGASSTLSLSSMPRRRESANGLNAWLIAELAAWAAQNGYGTISLNFAPFARLFRPDVTLGRRERLARAALGRAKAALSLQLDNLFLFNDRFCPRWEPRYVVYERRRDLPRVVVAAMAAEGYLPFSARLRGWGSTTRDDQTAPPVRRRPRRSQRAET
jgi:lysyl-tRNA synthetase class 2